MLLILTPSLGLGGSPWGPFSHTLGMGGLYDLTLNGIIYRLVCPGASPTWPPQKNNNPKQTTKIPNPKQAQSRHKPGGLSSGSGLPTGYHFGRSYGNGSGRRRRKACHISRAAFSKFLVSEAEQSHRQMQSSRPPLEVHMRVSADTVSGCGQATFQAMQPCRNSHRREPDFQEGTCRCCGHRRLQGWQRSQLLGTAAGACFRTSFDSFSNLFRTPF